MTATIEIPDDLYRRVEAKTAASGRRIREVTLELYEHWLAETPAAPVASPPRMSADWLEQWFREADAAMENLPSSPTARESLQEDRNRLERQ